MRQRRRAAIDRHREYCILTYRGFVESGLLAEAALAVTNDISTTSQRGPSASFALLLFPQALVA